MKESERLHFEFRVVPKTEEFLVLFRDLSMDPEELDSRVVRRVQERLEEGGHLQEVGIGGDMIAFSRPDLNFIIKFPYDDSSMGLRQRWSKRIRYGLFLAKRNLRGIVAPTTVIPILLELERNNREYPLMVIVQQKVQTAADVFKKLSLQGRFNEIEVVKKRFIKLTQEMWRRGIFDRDPDWEPNYGFTPRGRLFLIDIGDLSDEGREFPSYEGLPRKSLYEEFLQDTFHPSNFRRFFRRNLTARAYTPDWI